MGILAMLLVVAVIFIDGLFKKDTPGSLWTPAPTSYGVDDLTHLGLSFGLFMAGVCPLSLHVPCRQIDPTCKRQVCRPWRNTRSIRKHDRASTL
jgi:vesicular inhibitory amino acid transporter